MRDLFGAGGESVWMQPPFYCDYGSNILLGERVFFNFNCVVLDVCRVQVGDFTLFFAGFFPEAVASLPRLRPLSIDTFVDYVSAGKESYGVVAAFNLFEYRNEAPLFRRLSDRFEECVFGLNLVKREIEEVQGGAYRQLRNELGFDS